MGVATVENGRLKSPIGKAGRFFRPCLLDHVLSLSRFSPGIVVHAPEPKKDEAGQHAFDRRDAAFSFFLSQYETRRALHELAISLFSLGKRRLRGFDRHATFGLPPGFASRLAAVFSKATVVSAPALGRP